MLPSSYENQNCAIARALELVGERWTLLVVRDALLGIRRFEDFRDRLGVSRPVLSDRLKRLVDCGVFERVRYQQRPDRYEYVLTERGQELHAVVISLWQWGAAQTQDGASRQMHHRGCRSPIRAEVRCPDCGEELSPADVLSHPAPGVAISRAEHLSPLVRAALERERPLLEPVEVS